MTSPTDPGPAPCTVTIEGDNGSRVVEVVLPVTIGRAPDNDIVIDDSRASRYHARIDQQGPGLVLTDLGSANGTVLNGARIAPSEPFAFSDADEVLIASTRLRVSATLGGAGETATLFDGGGATRVAVPEEGHTQAMPRPLSLVLATAEGSQAVSVPGEEITIGRSPDNDVVISDNRVSSHHARVRRVAGGFEVTDLGSRNGLWLGGERVESCVLGGGESVRIGADAIRLQCLAESPVEVGAPQETLTLEPGKPLTIGRAQECDYVVDHPAVSRTHARISSTGPERYVVEDLGSSNGTYLNGTPVQPGLASPLYEGDIVQVGPVRLSIKAGRVQAETGREIRLDALNLTQEVAPGVNLLQDLTFSIPPREFVAIVGVSGAGKSTLLGALSGFRPASNGNVLLNGVDLYREFDAFRTSIGYVPQDDILHKDLPVERALDYSAQLRLPADTTPAERRERVNSVIQSLGLEQRRNVQVGRLSGGQRKRVSIGAELLTQPGLFFLDEATSGLDPGTESQMMRLLRELADNGHTILLITHATKNVTLCDRVVFLAAGGHLAFFGPPDEALEYFGVEDFDGIYELLENTRTPAEWSEMYRQSQAYQQHIVGRLADVPSPEARPAPSRSSNRKPVRRANAFSQFMVLSRRYLDIMLRDRTNFALLLLIAPVLGAIDLIAWPSDALAFNGGDANRAMTMLFLSALIPFLIGALTSVREIVKEAPIYERERTVSLQIAPYLGSKLIVGIGFSLYWALVLFAIKVVFIDLPDVGAVEYVQFYGTLFLAATAGVMSGLLISAVVPREEQAMLLAVGVIVLHVVFSGALVSLDELGIAGTILGGITSTHWALDSLVATVGFQSGNCAGPELANCQLPGFGEFTTDAERQVALDPIQQRFSSVLDGSVRNSWIALTTIIVVLFGALYALQKRKDVV